LGWPVCLKNRPCTISLVNRPDSTNIGRQIGRSQAWAWTNPSLPWT